MNLHKTIKVLMFDVDGTLVDHDCIMKDEVIEALKQLKEKGYHLCINSGRPYFMTLRLLKRFCILDVFSYIYGSNGAEVYDVEEGKVRRIASLAPETVKKLASYFKEEPIAVSFLTPEKIYVDKMIDPAVMDHYSRTRGLSFAQVDFETIDRPCTKLLGILHKKDHDAIEEKRRRLSDPSFDLFFSNASLLEMVPKGCSKGKACEDLYMLMGISKEEILSFGDEENDVSMFEHSIGVAMGNALEHIKEKADYVCGDVNEEGIVSFLEKNGFLSFSS